MAATSKHYGDVALWIEKVIDSCETQEQDRAARKLIAQFMVVHHDLEFVVLNKLTSDLSMRLDDRTMDRLENRLTALKHATAN
ncbi:hypothetical protein UFOVP1604_70 [uncultured Caudovirales phage]|uniref:Uncharacterized protein n=1 Tax=uncultured Caudovirales phage TaxID=2100421 RepID=A0A6J5SX21_9CAUD|nr:hypothetical protein UFOVP1604_70 [uncultured Caudovirales phage]